MASVRFALDKTLHDRDIYRLVLLESSHRLITIQSCDDGLEIVSILSDGESQREILLPHSDNLKTYRVRAAESTIFISCIDWFEEHSAFKNRRKSYKAQYNDDTKTWSVKELLYTPETAHEAFTYVSCDDEYDYFATHDKIIGVKGDEKNVSLTKSFLGISDSPPMYGSIVIRHAEGSAKVEDIQGSTLLEWPSEVIRSANISMPTKYLLLWTEIVNETTHLGVRCLSTGRSARVTTDLPKFQSKILTRTVGNDIEVVALLDVPGFPTKCMVYTARIDAKKILELHGGNPEKLQTLEEENSSLRRTNADLRTELAELQVKYAKLLSETSN